MMPFYLAAAAILVAALLLLLRPWLRAWFGRRPASAPGAPAVDTLQALNTAIHRDRLLELERDRANGVLSASDHAEALEELQRQLLDDTAASAATSIDPVKYGNRSTAIAMAVLVSVLGVSLYVLLGSPSAVLPADEQARAASVAMDKLVGELVQKLEKEPSPQGFAMLGRSYKAMGRWKDAELAFNRIGPSLEKDSGLLTDLAEVMAQQTRSFDGRPRELLQLALQVDGDNINALLLAGTDAFESKQYSVATALWSRLLKQLEPDSEDAKMIEASIAKAQELGGGKVAKVAKNAERSVGETAKATPKQANAPANTPTNAASAVSGRVELAAALRDKAKPDDVVFIFARAANVDGSPAGRMPLAAQRVRVADLPLNFTLDDSQAMRPDATISSVPSLRIEARISKSGTATPAKGDLAGKSAIIKPGAKGLSVVISEVVE
jgi:cytochrome c-type biogenesis protein CcmH